MNNTDELSITSSTKETTFLERLREHIMIPYNPASLKSISIGALPSNYKILKHNGRDITFIDGEPIAVISAQAAKSRLLVFEDGTFVPKNSKIEQINKKLYTTRDGELVLVMTKSVYSRCKLKFIDGSNVPEDLRVYKGAGFNYVITNDGYCREVIESSKYLDRRLKFSDGSRVPGDILVRTREDGKRFVIIGDKEVNVYSSAQIRRLNQIRQPSPSISREASQVPAPEILPLQKLGEKRTSENNENSTNYSYKKRQPVGQAFSKATSFKPIAPVGLFYRAVTPEELLYGAELLSAMKPLGN